MIDTKPIGLRFLLPHGAFLQIATTEVEASNLVRNFIQDNISPVVGKLDSINCWGIRTSDIVAIHTVPLDTVLPPVQGLPHAGWRPGTSGL